MTEYLVAVNTFFKISHGKTTLHEWKLYPIRDGGVIDERGNPRQIHLHPTVEFSVSIP